MQNYYRAGGLTRSSLSIPTLYPILASYLWDLLSMMMMMMMKFRIHVMMTTNGKENNIPV
ncbi:hypothetical protein HanPSC8_Chr01g0004431 [Helianthus annuus]|nr:hypothetical protein HanPSC8_Chr01g0004431 [Helianthus annuus]